MEQSRHEFVSMLAHDIRGLLGAVAAAVEMARVDLDELPDRDATRFLAIADRNTTELVDLTTNLLDTYRLEEGRLRPRRERLDLLETAKDVVDRLAPQAASRDTIVEVVGQPGEDVFGDPDLLRRVLLNLVSNALKFTPDGGRVTVTFGSPLKPPSGRDGVVVAVRDNGPGIAANDQEKLFVRFSPVARPGGRRPVGSGLGLAFCRQVVELHGGEILVESVPDRGSTFAFMLPRVEVPTVPARRRGVPDSSIHPSHPAVPSDENDDSAARSRTGDVSVRSK
jgi:signal transduction histidine kinase